MHLARLQARGFRNLERPELALAEGLTLLHGPNGAGKSNLLEACYFALAGRSCRTGNDREVIAFGAPVARAEVEVDAGRSRSSFAASLARDGTRQRTVDGVQTVPGMDLAARPPLGVFLPERLELIKGPPARRRAHIDRFVAALWPARAELRRRFGRALAQRNALLARIRGEVAPPALAAWDEELAETGIELMISRRDALAALAGPFGEIAAELGLGDDAALRYRPRSEASTAAELASELEASRDADVERGHSRHGPQLDEVMVQVGGRPLRRFGSQGEQRSALLALLLAEREVLAAACPAAPVMLFDDVLSELDRERRSLLLTRIAARGQTVITATEVTLLPPDFSCAAIGIRDGRIEPALAAG